MVLYTISYFFIRRHVIERLPFDQCITLLNTIVDLQMSYSDDISDLEDVIRAVLVCIELFNLFFAEVKCRLLQNAMYVGCCKIDLGGYTPKPL